MFQITVVEKIEKLVLSFATFFGKFLEYLCTPYIVINKFTLSDVFMGALYLVSMYIGSSSCPDCVTVNMIESENCETRSNVL
jgi:hypothetical protein